MNVILKQDGGTLCIAPEGRLDSRTAPELETVVEGSLNGVTDLTFDFEKIEYISSAGLRVLLGAQKIMARKGTMRIVNLNEIVLKIFEMTGFNDILPIE